jgi:hypothetical protein
VVVGTAAAHLAYLLYLPSGGFLALRWRRTFWLHLPTVCWGVGVVALEFPCPLTWLEAWARARAGMDPLPETGFIGRYVAGVLYPAHRTGWAQAFAFVAAAVSWTALAIQHRKAGYPSAHRSRHEGSEPH